jgi:hypothetical protein
LGLTAGSEVESSCINCSNLFLTVFQELYRDYSHSLTLHVMSVESARTSIVFFARFSSMQRNLVDFDSLRLL